MGKTFNNPKIKEFKEKIEEYCKKTQKQAVLSKEEIEVGHNVAIEYYTYLNDNSVPYGKAALDIRNREKGFGEFANLHLIVEARHVGKTEEEIKRVINELPIYLACRDMDMVDPLWPHIIYNKDIQLKSYHAIARYHYEALNIYGLSKYAWGGIFFQEFACEGSWMDVGGYDDYPKICATEAVNAYKANLIKAGISAREAFNSLIRTVDYEYKELSGSSVVKVGDYISFIPKGDSASAIFRMLWDSNSGKLVPNVLKRLIKDSLQSDNPSAQKLNKMADMLEEKGKDEFAAGMREAANIAAYGSEMMDIISASTEGALNSRDAFEGLEREFSKRGMKDEATVAARLKDETEFFTGFADLFLGNNNEDADYKAEEL